MTWTRPSAAPVAAATRTAVTLRMALMEWRTLTAPGLKKWRYMEHCRFLCLDFFVMAWERGGKTGECQRWGAGIGGSHRYGSGPRALSWQPVPPSEGTRSPWLIQGAGPARCRDGVPAAFRTRPRSGRASAAGRCSAG